MSKKLSQSEIDDLVSSLLQSEPAAETPAAPAPTAASAPQQSPDLVTFEQMQDLGPITQAELEEAEKEHRERKAAQAQPAVAQQVAAPAAPQTAPAAAAQAAPAAAAPQPAPAPAALAAAMAMPPSNAQYAASQAQSAAQTRRTLSMASLYGVLMDIDLTVTVELGRAHLSLGEVLALGPGSVITLEKLANSPVDVLVNRLPLMTAEVLAIGEKYGVRILESNMAAKEAS